MNKNIRAGKRLVAAALCAAMGLSSLGPQASSAAAQAVSASRAAASLPIGPVVLPASAAMPALSGFAAPSFGASPILSASALPLVAPRPVVVSPLPAAVAAMGRLTEQVARPLADPKTDVATHLGRVFDSARAATPAAVVSAPASPAGPSGLSRATARAPAVAPRACEAVPARAERQNRSASFPLVSAAASGVGWLAVKAVEYGLSALTAQAAVAVPTTAAVALGVVAGGMLMLGGAFLLNAVVDAAVYGAAMWRGRKVTDEDFRAFVSREVDADSASLLKSYRPQSKYPDFTFAFAAHGSIWMRPELIATPRLFRAMLAHELLHWKAASTRGPPPRGVRGLLSFFWSEIQARWAEFKGPSALKDLKISTLERVLREAQISLKRSAPYKILLLNPDSKELEDPGLYAGLSGGSAQVTAVHAAEPIAALGEAVGQGYSAVVLGNAASLLAPPRSKDALRMEMALKQLDALSLQESSMSPEAFKSGIRDLWRQVAGTKLKGLGASLLADRLYAGLSDRGLAFMSFASEDRGVAAWERLLRYWEADDGGKFNVTRVDLEAGGHIVVLRKIEERVGLWLRPVKGGRIEVSVPRASDSEQGRQAALGSLREAGFSDQLALFEKLDMRIRHVFGADVGRQELYITVPRRNVEALRRLVSADLAEVGNSDASFEPLLVESAGLQGVPPVWQMGVTGAGGKIAWVDTGADASHEDFGGRLDVVDMVNEGPEDWVGHGTHVAGISISGNAGFLGMAKAAMGTMYKVFSRDQAGASDGEIMGSATIAMQKGSDVISLSLGPVGRSSSADNLAVFFSQLTHQKNSAGEYPIVTASAGNSGPFDQTVSQPAAGVDVIAVAAAAKSLDDGRPEISFYSSVGPDIDRRFAVKRFRLKPEITGIGGDVTTEPGSTNVYKYGVYSAKSKDAPRSASDLEDGRHTGMSGTSMSNPAVAGIALLVKLAMKAAGAITPFVAENLPFAAKAVLMRSSKDLGVPVWFQGAGLVDAWAAVKLVAADAGRVLGSRLKRFFWATPVPAEGWGWLARLKAVTDAEDRVFSVVEIVKNPSQASVGDAPASEDESEVPAEVPSLADNTDHAETVKRFNEAREREIPGLLLALKDPVWLVRLRATFVLMNLRGSNTVLALYDVALNDPDARVRQMAFLALAEIPTHDVDVLLKTATDDPRWDVGVYAAYALARRGDRSGTPRLVREFSDPDKRARYTAAWLAGQLGVQATAAEAEALSSRARDLQERGNIRHLAVAALTNLADASPESISDRVVTDLLSIAGPENLALTRTLGKFFPVAVRERSFVTRLRSEPLKPIVMDFVLKNKGALQKPGSLAELVQLLASAAAIPLDAPTASLDLARPGLMGRIVRGVLAASIGALPLADSAKALVDRASAAALSSAQTARADSWWKDPSATRTSVTVPLYALRRDTDDPGVGKFTDLGRYYREILAPQGVDSVLLLPHFAVLDDSPYAPVSLYALNEDNMDWAEVAEVRRNPELLARLRATTQKERQTVDYAAVRERSGAVAAAAFAAFTRDELAQDTERGRDYRDFLAKNAGWLDEYSEFVALSKLIGKPVLDWTAEDQARARKDSSFAGLVDSHRFAQWNAYRQFGSAVSEVHAAGGRLLFDIPMFRAKNGVDAWKRPEAFADLRTRNPGIKNAWIDEDWKDLALWRWSKIKEDGYRMALDPYEHWMSFGFDGARVDALHFAYLFGNGQKASGDEPGDDYVGALSQVFKAHAAFPLAEAFEGKDADARRFGFVTVNGDWKKVSSHDDPRSPDFLGRYFRALSELSSGANAKFVAWTLGDEWRDPLPVKEVRLGRSFWTYRIPLPSDPDYAERARFDARSQLRVRKAMKDGDSFGDPEAVRTVLAEAADGFIKHDNGSVQIWAASMDWFLEEWGRDTFISLPGLLLSTKRYDEAKENIRRFSKFEHDGLIPNKIWDAGRWTPSKPDGADYNSADAPMWFIQAVQKTIAATGDMAFAAEMAPVLRRIVARWQSGTGYQRFGRFNAIKMDADGLVSTPAQASWMDADPEGQDHPVTPRNGKTVEINALWYANLRFLASLEAKLGSTDAGKPYDALADKVKASFNEKFWFVTEDNRRAWGGTGGALRDVVEGDPHGDAIRPNMLFAVSHGGDLLSPERQGAVVLAATKDLLTPFGLRTLSPRDSGYRERYETWKPPVEKDQAYHQGTVWPWLMGTYVDALARVRRAQGEDDARIRDEIRALMTPLIEHLVSRPEGSLPEVFDGGRPTDSPMVQNPGGTRSQAWSVAEVLRLLSEHGLVAPGYSGIP